jgi:hypothetical protein
MKQKPNFLLGALLITYSGIMSWLSAYSFVVVLLVGWKDYQELIISYLPWFNVVWLLIFAAIPIIIVALLELLIFQPSRVSYANEQAYKHDSPVKNNLKKILNNQEKIMDKLGIEYSKDDETN